MPLKKLFIIFRGISIKCKKDISDICIFPGEFIFIEEEEYDQLFVARLLKLYEDGKFFPSLPYTAVFQC